MRPATPLSLVFLAAAVLLLLTSLSTPVIKAFVLGENNGYSFGVWGFCNDEGCSPVQIGYSVEDITPTKFTLAPSTRHTVSYLLVVHPIAALLALVCFALAAAAHFHGPSHSTRFLLGLWLMTIPTFLFALMALLVDALLFIPHFRWGGWAVLAATVLILIASLVSCGLRRTLVSRKDQRRRINENAEMSGENYFNRQAAKTAAMPRVETPPLSGSTISYTEKTNGYGTTFDMQPAKSNMDDRIPLNPKGNGFRPMDPDPDRFRRAPNTSPYGPPATNSQYGPPANSNPYVPPANASPYGPPAGGMAGMAGVAMAYRGGFNGAPRGGFPPRGRGRYPLNGMGPPPPMGYGMRGGPPRRGRGYPVGPPGAMMGRRGPAPYDDGTNIDPYYEDTPANPPPGPSPSPPAELATSPPHGSDRGDASPVDGTERKSPTEMPSNNEYVPPRAQWANKPGPIPNRILSPIQGSPTPSASKPPGDGTGGYVEDVDPRFDGNGNQPAPPQHAVMYGANPSTGALPTRGPPPVVMLPHSASAVELRQSAAHDSALLNTPQQRYLRPQPVQGSSGDYLLTSYDSLPLASGQRSPGNMSESSHFTSVSQRGVNPAWGPPRRSRAGGSQLGPSREDIILDANPDFSLPPGRGGFRGRGRGRGMPGSGFGPGRSGSLPGSLAPSSFGGGDGAYPSVSVMRGPSAAGPGNRYPTPI